MIPFLDEPVECEENFTFGDLLFLLNHDVEFIILSDGIERIKAGEKIFTVYDVLSVLFREISFHGYDEDKEKIVKE